MSPQCGSPHCLPAIEIKTVAGRQQRPQGQRFRGRAGLVYLGSSKQFIVFGMPGEGQEATSCGCRLGRGRPGMTLWVR